MATFFVADTHFGHANIIRFDGRPFATIEEHDDALIRNWNNTVGKEDDVWHLGDFSFRNARSVSSYLGALSGRVHLVRGNHDDKGAWKHRDLFASAQEAAYINVDGQRMYLCHYSCRVWRASNHGSIHLFGHSHGGLNRLGDALGRSMDVGVNVNGYRPVSFQEVMKMMDSRPLLPHHEEREGRNDHIKA